MLHIFALQDFFTKRPFFHNGFFNENGSLVSSLCEIFLVQSWTLYTNENYFITQYVLKISFYLIGVNFGSIYYFLINFLQQNFLTLISTLYLCFKTQNLCSMNTFIYVWEAFKIKKNQTWDICREGGGGGVFLNA